MARITYLQSVFARGEISPLAQGRARLPQYEVGLAECLNFVVGERGELHRRPGSLHVAGTPDNAEAILIPFQPAAGEAYLLEVSQGRMRFYHDHSRLAQTLSLPYTSQDLAALRYAQIAEALYLVHPGHAPKVLTRSASGTFQLANHTFHVPAWQSQNTDPGASLATSSGVVTASGIAPFNTGDVGRALRIFDGVWKQHTITEVLSTTRVRITPTRSLPATTQWQLGAFYTGNYPSQIVFHEDRLVLAAPPDRPQSFWMSQPADYGNFAPNDADGTVQASSAIAGTLNDNQIHKIHWLTSLDSNVLAGTESGVWVIRSGATAEGLTPLNITARRQHATASAASAPVLVGDALMFLNRARRKLYSLTLEGGLDHYRAQDQTQLADHILTSGGQDMAFQEAPHRLLWLRRGDGLLASLSFNAEQELVGWSRHALGGPDAAVEALASLPAPGAEEGDDLWLVVRRKVGGSIQRSVERLAPFFDYETPWDQAHFVDAGVVATGTGITAISGLEHLEGQSVSVFTDGVAQDQAVVTGGGLTLSAPGDRVHLGYGYASVARILDLEAGGNDGSALGKPRHIFEVVFRLWRAWGLEAGHDLGVLRALDFDQAGSLGDFSGLVRLKRDEGGWRRATQLVVQQTQPYPATLLALALRLEVEGG